MFTVGALGSYWATYTGTGPWTPELVAPQARPYQTWRVLNCRNHHHTRRLEDEEREAETDNTHTPTHRNQPSTNTQPTHNQHTTNTRPRHITSHHSRRVCGEVDMFDSQAQPLTRARMTNSRPLQNTSSSTHLQPSCRQRFADPWTTSKSSIPRSQTPHPEVLRRVRTH